MRLRNLGWLEFFLPDSSVYFIHPSFRVATDIDLHSLKKLDAVSAYLDRLHRDVIPQGMELWLREPVAGSSSGGPKRGYNPVSQWVNHMKRTVTVVSPFDPAPLRTSRGSAVAEDRKSMKHFLFVGEC